MQDYHYEWLKVHDTFSEEDLASFLKQGFHIHHVDGDVHNNNASNLVLIHSVDHFRIHNGSLATVGLKPKIENPRKKLRNPDAFIVPIYLKYLMGMSLEYISDQEGLTVTSLLSRLKRFSKKHGVPLVIKDKDRFTIAKVLSRYSA